MGCVATDLCGSGPITWGVVGCVVLDVWEWSALLSYYVLSVGVEGVWIPSCVYLSVGGSLRCVGIAACTRMTVIGVNAVL